MFKALMLIFAGFALQWVNFVVADVLPFTVSSAFLTCLIGVGTFSFAARGVYLVWQHGRAEGQVDGLLTGRAKGYRDGVFAAQGRAISQNSLRPGNYRVLWLSEAQDIALLQNVSSGVAMLTIVSVNQYVLGPAYARGTEVVARLDGEVGEIHFCRPRAAH